MTCNWITTPSGVTAHVNGDVTDPEARKAIEAVIDAAHNMLKEQEDEPSSTA
jgi:hypothetical protein